MKTLSLRLNPGMDLRKELDALVDRNKVNAGFILTCVGSLESAVLRMADGKTVNALKGPFEIVSLVGTLSPDGSHLHISVSDPHGDVIGGHMKEGCIINTTAEVVIGVDDAVLFSRVRDPRTGYDELVIKNSGMDSKIQ